MRALFICTVFITTLTTGANAGEVGDEYLAFLEARAALLDSMEHAIAPLDTEGLRFLAARDSTRTEQWARLTREAIGHLRNYAQDYRDHPSLHNAMRFEFSWQRVRHSWMESIRLSIRLQEFISQEMNRIQQDDTRDEIRATLDRIRTTQEVGRVFSKRSTAVGSAIRELEMAYLSMPGSYIKAASDELERTGWQP